jgi:hypothetical protein
MAPRIVTLACLVHWSFAVRVDTHEKAQEIIQLDTGDELHDEANATWGLDRLSNLGTGCDSNWCEFTSHMASFTMERFRLERAARSWETPAAQDLQKPLLAAKLCQASYEDRATVEQVVAAEGMQLLDHNERYYFASKPDGEVFVVFRGTADLHDVLVDLFVVPTEHNGAMYHSGFLHFIQRPNLQAALRRHANSPRVTLTGHSLGGANAYALAASGLMPVGHVEEVITFGAPAVIHEASENQVNRDFRHTAFANKGDPVPRLLGSDPTVLGDVLNLYRDLGSGTDTPSQNVLEEVSHYGQQGHAVWLRGNGGRPYTVPDDYRTPVMLLQMIISVTSPPANVLAEHLMSGYRGGIEQEIRSPSPAPAPSFWR